MKWRVAIVAFGIMFALAGLGIGLTSFDARQDGGTKACGSPFRPVSTDEAQRDAGKGPNLDAICRSKADSRREVALNMLVAGGVSTAAGVVAVRKKKL